MIEEPPLLQIVAKDKRRRPSDALIARFDGAETGQVCDAMGGTGAMSHEIKPLGALPPRILGPALTVGCGPADILALLAAIAEAQSGDVLVVSTDNFREAASLGDQVANMAKNAGISGVVTDGMARDIGGIEAVGLPVFGAGLSPNSPYSKGPGTVGLEIIAGGRPVRSGDLIVGDRDGVAVVPFERLEQTADALDQVRAAEAALAGEVAKGLRCPEAITELLASDQTAYV